MKQEKFLVTAALALSMFSFGISGGGQIPEIIEVKSSAFSEGSVIPTIYTCDGEDISPELHWSNFPSETKSFVLIADDPDAPVGVFTHWIMYDIPVTIHKLPENFPKVPEVEGIKQGINDFGKIGYGGPCPPPGPPHRYFFKIYALDTPSLGLPAGATKSQVERAIARHILAKGHLMGSYGR